MLHNLLRKLKSGSPYCRVMYQSEMSNSEVHIILHVLHCLRRDNQRLVVLIKKESPVQEYQCSMGLLPAFHQFSVRHSVGVPPEFHTEQI